MSLIALALVGGNGRQRGAGSVDGGSNRTIAEGRVRSAREEMVHPEASTEHLVATLGELKVATGWPTSFPLRRPSL